MLNQTIKSRIQLILAFISLVPFILTIFLGYGRESALIVAAISGIAIVASGFALAWATESLQFIVSQVLALAVLAIVQVLPEYSIEVILSYHGAFDPVILHYATASMTGANRLLLGLGWPSVFIISYIISRRNGDRSKVLHLSKDQSVQITFLGLATIYSFAVILKGTLGLIDAFVLALIFSVYIYFAKRIPPVSKEYMEGMEGPALMISNMRGIRKKVAISSLLLLGTFMIYFGAEPFIDSLIEIGASLKLDEYLLIQWLAPILTEFPEAVTVVYWSAKVGRGPLALGNLVSSKLNQWTLLIATIPLAYTVALNQFKDIVLTKLQIEELLLTSSQSIYGFICLMDLKLSLMESISLLTLFLVQFFIPSVRVEVSIAYFALSIVELVMLKGRVEVFRQANELIRGKV